jgi:hypothetical protein
MPSTTYAGANQSPRDLAEWPVWRSTLRLIPDNSKDADAPSVFDVKFFPWTFDDDPVFAYVMDRCAVVCRAEKGPRNYSIEELVRFETTSDDAFNSLTWAMHPTDRRPLLCVSGRKPLIHIFDVVNKKILRFLSGHGDVKYFPRTVYAQLTRIDDQ